jgi:hypothetical protein
MKCLLCGNKSWRVLPVPVEAQSISTSGIVIAQPMEREQCMSCGVLQETLGRKDAEFGLGHIEPTSMFGRVAPLETLDEPDRVF